MSMTDEKIDFSPLATTADPDRWNSAVERTLARIADVLQQPRVPPDPLFLIAGWIRPILAAAAVVIAILIPAEIALESREENRERVDRLVQLTSRLSGDQALTAAEFVRALGERHRR
jgi:hypothetical protein